MRGPATSNAWGLGLVAAGAAAAWGLQRALPPYVADLFVLIGINGLLAVSLNLVNGVAGQFSLGHAGFMALGAYAAAWLGAGPLAAAFAGPYAFLALLGTLAAGALVAGSAGWLVGLPSLRLKGDYLAIVTLGFGEIIRVGLLNSAALGGARGFIGIPPAGGAAWVWGILALTCLGLLRVAASSSGRALASVREDEIAAEALGVDTTRRKVAAFAASAALAGVAGALFAHQEGYLNPDSFGFMKSVEIVVMVVLGGMGSMSGALLAAALLTALPEALRPLKAWTGVDLRMVLYALALVLLMIFRPQGLLGRGELWDFKRRRPA